MSASDICDGPSAASDTPACEPQNLMFARLMLAIVGEAGLSPADRRALAFAEAFDHRFVGQGRERRSLAQTFEAGWRLLDGEPRDDLIKLSDEVLAQRAARRGT